MNYLRCLCVMFIVFYLSGCSDPSIVDNTQNTIYGVVVDCAMSTVSSKSLHARQYTTIKLSSGEELSFWSYDENSRPNNIDIGDFVKVESAIENGSNLLVATKITELIPISVPISPDISAVSLTTHFGVINFASQLFPSSVEFTPYSVNDYNTITAKGISTEYVIDSECILQLLLSETTLFFMDIPSDILFPNCALGFLCEVTVDETSKGITKIIELDSNNYFIQSRSIPKYSIVTLSGTL